MSRAALSRAALALSLVAASAGVTADVEAQARSVQVDQYRPAPTVSDLFALSRPDDRGHLNFGARLDLDYALNPLVVETMLGSAASERASLIEHQIVGNLSFSLGLFERLVVFAGLGVNLLQTGTPIFGMPGGDGAGLGDLTLGARGRLFGEPDDAFALALQLRFALPTALAANSSERYSGEAATAITPELLAEIRPGDIVRITANLGARLRTDSPARLASLAAGHELTWGLGVTVDAIEDELAIYLEGFGSSSFETIGNARSRETTPFEVLLGARGSPVSGFWVGGGVGTGLTRGYGTPDFRGVVTLGYDHGPFGPPPPPPEPPPPSDRDGDGLIDEQDGCPDDPEDFDQFEDADGCPDPDNDHDGILDGADECPLEPEDIDEFEDANGCPDPDNDQDGILDTADQCPLEPEDMDGWRDDDGCPEADNDRDTLIDPEDRCPNEPGPVSEGGCPRAIRLDTEGGEIRILQSIEFETDSDVLVPAGEAILEEIRAVLDVNTHLTRVRVEGHTDSRHSDEHNLDLSARRARTVVRWLVAHGIDASRLVAFGCGEAHPIDVNRTSAGRQRNRRVVFQILEPATSHEGTPIFTDCREATQ